MPGFKWQLALLLGTAALSTGVRARAAEEVQGFCSASKNPQPFYGKTVRFRAMLVHPRSGAPLNSADDLIVTSAACPDQGFIADTKNLLASSPKERRFELVGKLIGGQLPLDEVVGIIQPPTSPHLMAKLVATSVRPASGPPAR